MTATADAPLPITIDTDDVHAEAADVLAVYHGVLVTFDAAREALLARASEQAPQPPAPDTDDGEPGQTTLERETNA